MSQRNVFEAAKQGNPDAIAVLINRSLQQRQIIAKVIRKDNCLKIMLESSNPLNQSSLVIFISNGIRKLEVFGIDTLQVFGRRIGEEIPAWSQTIILEANQPSDEINFKVKHNDQELVAHNVEELKGWIRIGQVSINDYVYNPILKKWMYVRELAEVESVVKQKESSSQAEQYNRTSFVFAGIGLLMLFIFPLAGIVLLLIAIVFSAMYYTQQKT